MADAPDRASGSDGTSGAEGARRSVVGLVLDVTRQLFVLGFVKASGLVATVVLARVLGIDGLGAWVAVSTGASLLSVVCGLGMYQAVVQFYPEAKSAAARRAILRDALGIVVGAGALLAALVLGLGAGLGVPPLSRLEPRLLALACALGLLFALRLVLLNHERALGDLRRYSTATLLSEVLELGFCLGAALLFRSVEAVAVGAVLALLCVCLGLARPLLGPRERSTLRGRMLSYGAPLAGTQLADTALARGDRLLVGALLGSAATGVYSGTYALVSLPAVLSSAMTTVLFPRLAAGFWSTSDERRMRRFTLGAYWLSSLLLLGALTFGSRRLLSLVLGIDASLVDVDVPFLFFSTGFGICLFGGARIQSLDLFVGRRTGALAIVWVSAALLNLGLNRWLLPRIGLAGAGVANLAAYSVFFLLVQWARRKRPRELPREI